MDLLRAAAPYLAYSYLTFVGKTSRVHWLGLDHVEALARFGRPFIYAFWHQRQALFTYTHRGIDGSVLVSRSRDGEIIAETMRLSAIPCVRGSSSRRAAESAKELLDILAAGRCAGITPDGPKGPARKVKDGAVFLAMKSGCALLPITNAASRVFIVERAWDRFQLPLPFSRICVHHGTPIFVRPDDDPKKKAQELENSLNAITEEADVFVR
ncbi:MAG: lysophospholipid acyltransferase family protein [Elusimicrobia bacterium]|nr:lysophospholipid acyltransferase family protein [Elusimicrobiota bacterium]